jgi:hypothetical protein
VLCSWVSSVVCGCGSASPEKLKRVVEEGGPGGVLGSEVRKRFFALHGTDLPASAKVSQLMRQVPGVREVHGHEPSWVFDPAVSVLESPRQVPALPQVRPRMERTEVDPSRKIEDVRTLVFAAGPDGVSATEFGARFRLRFGYQLEKAPYKTLRDLVLSIGGLREVMVHGHASFVASVALAPRRAGAEASASSASTSSTSVAPVPPTVSNVRVAAQEPRLGSAGTSMVGLSQVATKPQAVTPVASVGLSADRRQYVGSRVDVSAATAVPSPQETSEAPGGGASTSFWDEVHRSADHRDESTIVVAAGSDSGTSEADDLVRTYLFDPGADEQGDADLWQQGGRSRSLLGSDAVRSSDDECGLLGRHMLRRSDCSVAGVMPHRDHDDSIDRSDSEPATAALCAPWVPASAVGAGDGRGSADAHVFLNTSQPFCLVTVGVQGAGKSHTLGVVAEALLLPHNSASEAAATLPPIRLRRPVTTLVLHFDDNISGVCEVLGVAFASRRVQELRRRGVAPDPGVMSPDGAVPLQRVVVLVSPANYQQRRAFYASMPGSQGSSMLVLPLLFRWRQLTASHLKTLMRLDPKDSQLYVATMLDRLRQYQRRGSMPDFETFVQDVLMLCGEMKTQQAPLMQRVNLLRSMVAESEANVELLTSAGLKTVWCDLSQLVGAASLIVADLTDPLLAPDEAACVFEVLLKQVR